MTSRTFSLLAAASALALSIACGEEPGPEDGTSFLPVTETVGELTGALGADNDGSCPKCAKVVTDIPPSVEPSAGPTCLGAAAPTRWCYSTELGRRPIEEPGPRPRFGIKLVRPPTAGAD